MDVNGKMSYRKIEMIVNKEKRQSGDLVSTGFQIGFRLSPGLDLHDIHAMQ